MKPTPCKLYKQPNWPFCTNCTNCPAQLWINDEFLPVEPAETRAVTEFVLFVQYAQSGCLYKKRGVGFLLEKNTLALAGRLA